MTEEREIYYREENARWSDDLLAIKQIRYWTVRKTPKGRWVAPLWDHKGRYVRFVLDGKGKRFAYPTPEEARMSFIIRKTREIGHAAAKLDRAKRYLALAKTGNFGTETEALHEIRRAHFFIVETSPARH